MKFSLSDKRQATVEARGDKVYVSLQRLSGPYEDNPQVFEVNEDDWNIIVKAGNVVIKQLEVQREFVQDLTKGSDNWTGQR